MLDELLQLKKININQYEIYMLFEASEVGKKWLNYLRDEAFLDTPLPNLTPELLAYQHGRCSVARDIIVTVNYIQQLLKEHVHDSGEQDGEQGRKQTRRRKAVRG
jgi:hypothetical protein